MRRRHFDESDDAYMAEVLGPYWEAIFPAAVVAGFVVLGLAAFLR